MKIKEGGVMDIQENRKEHMLKTDPAVFQDVLDGSKTFEIRFNDRGYQVDDLIVLKETKFTGQQMKSGQPLVYTGREIQKRISYVLSGYGLQEGWVILGIQDIEAAKASAVPEGFVEKTESNTHHYFKLKDWNEWSCIDVIKDAITSDYDINSIVEVEQLEVVEIQQSTKYGLLRFAKRHGDEVVFFDSLEEAQQAQEPANE